MEFLQNPQKRVTLYNDSNNTKSEEQIFEPQNDDYFESARGSVKNIKNFTQLDKSYQDFNLKEDAHTRLSKYHEKIALTANKVDDEIDFCPVETKSSSFKHYCPKIMCKNLFIDTNTPYQEPIYEDKNNDHISVYIGKLSLSKKLSSKNSQETKEMVNMKLIIENKTNVEIENFRLKFKGDESLIVKTKKQLKDINIKSKGKHEINLHFFVKKVPYTFQKVYGLYWMIAKNDKSEMIKDYEFEFTIPVFFHQFFIGSPEFKKETFEYQWKLFKSIASRYITDYFQFNKEVLKEECDMLKIFPNRVDLGEVFHKSFNSVGFNNLQSKILEISLKQIGLILSFESYTFMIRITFDDNLVGFQELVTENTKEDTSRVAKFQLQNQYIVLKNNEESDDMHLVC